MSHTAIVIVAPRAPLETRQLPTPKPKGNQVLIRNEWTSTQPLDLHRADGGLLKSDGPDTLGDGASGEVVETGDEVQRLKVGDKVFGFAWSTAEERSHQTYSLISENLLAKVPPNLTLPEVATVSTNFVTVFHTIITVLGLPLPWPKPASYTPPAANEPLLIWGGSSSVGQFALQILSYYGYRDLIAVASSRHHTMLSSLGATKVFDYNDSGVLSQIRAEIASIPYFLDCIGSAPASITPISKLARSGSKVAVLLPVILARSTPASPPEYSYDVSAVADWEEGVQALGVRTHAYLENEFLARVLQPEIMPELLEIGVVRPNRYRVIEGRDMLERAQNALRRLREGVSGEKLVWKVMDESECGRK